MVSAGRLNSLLVVERKELDLGLGIKPKYVATGTKCYASIRQTTANEQIAAGQVEARASHVIETHWPLDVKAADRLREEETGRLFNIGGVENVRNENRVLRITCTEVVT